MALASMPRSEMLRVNGVLRSFLACRSLEPLDEPLTTTKNAAVTLKKRKNWAAREVWVSPRFCMVGYVNFSLVKKENRGTPNGKQS